MPERPDIKFAKKKQEEIEQFCSSEYDDGQKQTACQKVLTDKLTSDPEPSQEPESKTEQSSRSAPPQRKSEQVAVGDRQEVTDPNEPEGIETLIHDCLGSSSLLGGRKPNTEACMRAVRYHERQTR